MLLGCLTAALAWLACLGGPITQAGAVEQIEARFFLEFSSTSYSIDQGELVTFFNRDPFAVHSIASAGPASFGASPAGYRQKRLVRGAPFLPAGGPYPFRDPAYPAMTSALTVSTAGTPLPPDATPPTVAVRILTRSLSALARTRKLRVRVWPSEPVDTIVKAVGPGGVLARSEQTYLAAGPKRATLTISKPVAKRLRALERRARLRPVRFRLRVAARVSDVAGLAGKAFAARSLRVPRPRPMLKSKRRG